MPELTDSYCERCGLRHVFSASGSKRLSLKRARVLVKGLKNFVLTDGQSMSDSITAARLEYESGDASRMTEAFHKAFNFCMTCRQYACDKCWNAQVGACLSCAPQADSAPVEPEGHLIVRTPVARWDPNWLNLSDPEGDTAASSSTPSLPAGWPGPLQFSPMIPPQARQDHFTPKADQPTAPGQPATWPTADLPGPATADTGSNDKTGLSARMAADPEAWSVWPAADELAPEMTLTAEEMILVEAELSHPESGKPVAASALLVEDAGGQAAGAGLETIPSRSTVPTWEPVVTSQPFAAISAALDLTAGAIAEMTPVPQAQTPVTPESSLASASPMAQTPVLPVQPAPPADTRHEPVEAAGFVARLLGHHRAQDTGGTPARPEPTAGGGVPTEQWPHATPWIESPLSARRWSGGAEDPSVADPRADLPADVAADLPADVSNELAAHDAAPGPLPEGITEAVAEAVAEAVLTPPGVPQPAYQGSNTPAPDELEPAGSDATLAAEPQEPAAPTEARSAAAIHEMAVTHSANSQPDEVATAEPVTQIEVTARPEADAQVAEVERRKTTSQPAPSRQATGAAPSKPPVSWPPFAASWPAPNPHRGTWPGPAAPLPAVVAAQHAQPLFAAEMWAQSSQEVMSRGTVRVCHHCALPVSTQARFCRRCGTQQA